MNRVIKIAITGGPCAGKTSSLLVLKNALSAKGYLVFTIPESATELMSNGATYPVCGSAVRFQTSVFKLQTAKESLYKDIAMDANKDVIILCDRGTVDCLAYLDKREQIEFLKRNAVEKYQLLYQYDGAFFMVTAAIGASDMYGIETNAVRFESIDEAVISDRKILSEWSDHPYLCVIDNSTNFTEKLVRLCQETISFVDKIHG